jgi:phosphoglycolate phosphatase
MKPHIKPSAVVFDFDDTLIDAKFIIKKALSATFDQFNISKDVLEQKNIDINRSLRDYFHHIFADNIKEARDAYYFHYDHFSKDLSALEGAEEVLKLLHHNKVYTAIVSNKGGERLRKEVKEKLAWQNYFASIIGSGDAQEDKPSPKSAELALKDANLEHYNDVWFIGDSLVDLETAANLTCKGILFGNSHSNHNLPHYHSVANHDELLKLFQGIYNV